MNQAKMTTRFSTCVLFSILIIVILLPNFSTATISPSGNISPSYPVGLPDPWNVGSDLTIGYSSNSTITINSGSSVNNLSGYIGYGGSSSGSVTVTGAGSQWVNSGSLNVGSGGDGVMDISDGGSVDNTQGYIGRYMNSSGSVTVTGVGSQWVNSDLLSVGEYGDGVMEISDGGSVDSAMGYIGFQSSGSGSVTVTGVGSQWVNSDSLSVGLWGTGEMLISDGGSVDSAMGYIGSNSGSSGSVTVTGVGSQWVNSDSLSVGGYGDGVMEISDGGSVDSAMGYIGSNSGSSGTVTVTGAGSNWTSSGGLYVGGALYSAGGLGSLTISDGGVVDFTGSSIVWSQGTVNISGGANGPGTLNVDSGDTLTVKSGGTFNLDSGGLLSLNGGLAFEDNAFTAAGIITGNGTFTINSGSGTLTASGKVSPGNSIGTIVITGNYVQNAGSTLEVEVEKTAVGALNSDLLDVSGTATLEAGSTINVIDISTVGVIATGDTFTIIDADGGVTDNGPTITDSSEALSFTGQVNGNSYELVVTGRAAFAGLVGINKSLMAAIDSDLPQATGDYETIIDALTGLGSVEELDNASEQLSPRPHASTTYENTNTGYRLADDIAGHLRSRRMGVARRMARDSQARRNQLLIADASSDPRKLASLIRKERELAAEEQKQMDGEVRTFFRPIGVFYDRDSLSKMTGFRANSVGGQFGLDKSYGPNLIAGIAGGYTRGWIKYKESRGEADIDSLRIGPYASYFKDNYFIDASLSFGYHINKSERNIRFGAIDRTAKSDYDAFDISAYVGGGYDIYARDWKVTPSASLQLTNYHREGFKETGAGSANIMVDSSTSNSLRSRLGVICSTITQIKGRPVAPELFAGWSHEFIDDEDISGRFVNGSAKFSSGIDSSGDDRFYYGAGMTALLKENISAYIRYEGESFSGGNSHTLNAGVKILF